MSDPTETEAPATPETHPLDEAIASRKAEWAKESKASVKAPTKDHPSGEDVDTAEVSGPAPVSGDGAAPSDTPKKAPKGDRTSDLSWLPTEFHSPQARQGPEFLAWMKKNVHAQSKFTKEMQELAEQRKQYAADLEVGQTIRTKRPDIAEIAFRMSKGESIQDIAASMKSEEKAASFNYGEAAYEDIDKHIESVAERKAREVRERELRETQVTESQREAVQDAIINFVKENDIDPQAAFAAVQAASDAIKSGDEIPWTAEKAGRILKKYLNGASPKNTRNGQSGEVGLSKVASPSGLGVGVKASPPLITREIGKKWADGSITDEERMRIFSRLPASGRRAQDEGATDE